MDKARRAAVLMLIAVFLFPLAGPPVDAAPEGIDALLADGLAWLNGAANPLGSWGDPAGTELRDTAVVLETLRLLGETGSAYENGLNFLASTAPSGNDDLAREAAALTRAGVDVTSLVNDLLAAQNAPWSGTPNAPEGGWGIAAGYASDVLDTALALEALDAAGLAGGLSVAPKTIAAGAVHQYQYELPPGATSLDVLINPMSGNIRVRVKVGSPPTTSDPYYNVTAPTYLGGLSLAPGTHYIRIDGVAASSTYGLQVTYVANGFDTASLIMPVDYLQAAQRADGGWGLQVGADASNVYLTSEVLLALQRYRTYFDVTSAISSGAQWLVAQQNPDGSWGSTVYETALSFYTLDTLGVQPGNSAAAVGYLLNSQAADGSWNGQPYDTAVAVLALATRTPAAVTGLTISTSQPDSVLLNWTAVTTNVLGNAMAVDHYNIYRDTSPYFLASPATLWKTSASAAFLDTGVLMNPAVNYFYRVGAVSPEGSTGTSTGHVGKFEFTVQKGQ